MRRVIWVIAIVVLSALAIFALYQAAVHPTPQVSAAFTTKGFEPREISVKLGVPGGSTGLVRITNKSAHAIKLCVVGKGACLAKPSWATAGGDAIGTFQNVAAGGWVDIRFTDEASFTIAPSDHLTQTLVVNAATVGRPEGG